MCWTNSHPEASVQTAPDLRRYHRLLHRFEHRPSHPTAQSAEQYQRKHLLLPGGHQSDLAIHERGLCHTAEQGPVGSTNPNDPPQAIFVYNQSATNGQLTLTQNTPTPTGATAHLCLRDAAVHLRSGRRPGRLYGIHSALHHRLRRHAGSCIGRSPRQQCPGSKSGLPLPHAKGKQPQLPLGDERGPQHQ